MFFKVKTTVLIDFNCQIESFPFASALDSTTQSGLFVYGEKYTLVTKDSDTFKKKSALQPDVKGVRVQL